eukprot:m.54435 g.54435  ORF g.54435 m.54435 type:complete len:87 (+) comp34368_c0_seq1:260-520(+)
MQKRFEAQTKPMKQQKANAIIACALLMMLLPSPLFAAGHLAAKMQKQTKRTSLTPQRAETMISLRSPNLRTETLINIVGEFKKGSR